MVELDISFAAFKPHEEDQLRASLYSFLANILSTPPNKDTLKIASSFTGDQETELGIAFRELSEVAASMDVETAEREYLDLFIGLSRGELLPYASYYLTGFLNEKPLAKLRDTLSAMGIERADHVNEPEDHIGALCDIMSGLITGQYTAPASLEVQRHFFSNHIAKWAPYFFKDLENTETAKLYKPIGRMGKEFMTIEQNAFGMS